MRSADDHAARETQRARQIGDARGGYWTRQRYINARGGESGLKRRFQHITGDARVFPINTVGWPPLCVCCSPCASTLPAAYPRRKTKSGVTGATPTLPRIPSVPK